MLSPESINAEACVISLESINAEACALSPEGVNTTHAHYRLNALMRSMRAIAWKH
jgi:hypothetical protein